MQNLKLIEERRRPRLQICKNILINPQNLILVETFIKDKIKEMQAFNGNVKCKIKNLKFNI